MSVGLCTAPGQALEGIDAMVHADARAQLDAAVGDSKEGIGEEKMGAGRGVVSVALTGAAAATGGGTTALIAACASLRCALLAR